MKKLLALVMAAVLVLGTAPAFAAPGLTVEAWVDYEAGTINAYYTTDAIYASRVTVTVTKSGSSSIADFVRIYEGEANAEEEEEITFVLGDDISTGSYDVKVTLGGKNSAGDTATISILNNLDAAAYLAAINGAAAADIYSKLVPVKDAIGIEFDGIYTANQQIADAALISIRTNDYEGSFASLSQAAVAFNQAKAVALIKTASNATAIKTYIGEYGALLGIDAENEEYAAYTDAVCAQIFENIDKINNCKSANSVFETSVAFVAVTNCKPSEADAYFKKYKEQLGIQDYMEEYEACGEKAKVARLVQQAKPKDASEVAQAFSKALDEIANGQEDSYTPPKGGSGGGGGSSVSGPAINTEAQAPANVTFSDIADTEWAREYIEALAAMGIVNGYENGTFRGNGTVTREEFVKMLVCAFEFDTQNSECSFDDVGKSNWAYSYIAAAVDMQIISGVSSDKFGFGEGITRQDMAVILFRLAKLNGLEIDENLDIEPFADHDNIGDYAREGVYVMRKTGVINGFDDGTFKPTVTLTRAEAAKVIYEMLRVKY